MADWQEQLNSILSDPDAMAQIAALAQSLGAADAEEKKPEHAEPLDSEQIGRIIPLMRQLNHSEGGEAAALLRALRPFLSDKRRAKIERAAQLARLIHLGKTFLSLSQQETEDV